MLVDFAQIPFTWVRLTDSFAAWADPQDPVNVLSRLPPPQSRKHNTSTVCESAWTIHHSCGKDSRLFPRPAFREQRYEQ